MYIYIGFNMYIYIYILDTPYCFTAYVVWQIMYTTIKNHVLYICHMSHVETLYGA